jgi:hypothetical protein
MLRPQNFAPRYHPARLPLVPESRLAIVAALEALEAGDRDYAESILLSTLEDEHREQRRRRCPECGLDCLWPGRLADHRRQIHQVAA